MEESFSKKIFGPEKHVKKAEKFFRLKYNDQETLKGEREKSQDEIQIINAINEVSNEVLASYDIEPINVRSGHVHVLKPESFEQMLKDADEPYDPNDTTSAIFSDSESSIFIKDTQDLYSFGYLAAHETYHAKSYKSYTAEGEKSRILGIFPRELTQINSRRVGFGTFRKEEEGTEYFLDIDEAITDLLADRTMEKILTEKKLPSDLLQKIEEDYENLVIKISGGYFLEKARFWEMMREIHRKNEDKFNGPNDVFLVFIKGYFSGNYLKAAKLIEKTYGKGSFRSIGKEGMPPINTTPPAK